jgi:4-hydroxy-2-oxoheptanedioate aldolase
MQMLEAAGRGALDKVRQAQAAGRPAIGSWVAIGNGVSAELMGRAGFDFVALDGQHGGIDWHNMADTLRAVELGSTQTLVRVPWCTADYIMRTLDLGAGGVIVPMVSTPQEAALAAQACRYPPHGNRSFGKVRSYYSADGEAIDPLCMVMIETAEAMENLYAIAATPGVDGLFVGPVDLGLSLGLGLALQMPEAVFAACDKVIGAAARHGKIAGCAALGEDNARQLAARGMRFIALGSDSGFVRAGAAAAAALARELHGDG